MTGFDRRFFALWTGHSPAVPLFYLVKLSPLPLWFRAGWAASLVASSQTSSYHLPNGGSTDPR